jgi:hypothetical protein
MGVLPSGTISSGYWYFSSSRLNPLTRSAISTVRWIASGIFAKEASASLLVV